MAKSENSISDLGVLILRFTTKVFTYFTIEVSDTLEMVVRFYDSSHCTILTSETLEMIVRFYDSSDSTILPSETRILLFSDLTIIALF